jgi:hypothetical protein
VKHIAVRVIDEPVRECSTRAARDFVRTVRSRLQAEVERQGEQATQTRSYQRLERSISPDALRQTWPEADIEAVLNP